MSTPFGTTRDGARAQRFTLTREDGVAVRISDFGATLVAVHLPDRDGVPADVVLGFDSVEGYQSPANAYFGATVGRVANRIAHAAFAIGDRTYTLAANEAPHHLHGGPDRGFARVLWQVTHVDEDVVELAYDSPAGEEGYPGRLRATARYTLGDRGLEVRYRAIADEATPVNMTNHTYWNLAGAGRGTVLDHELQLVAARFTPTDAGLIPTGEVVPVAGTALDFRTAMRVGERIDELIDTPARGYDHNLVIDGDAGRLRLGARLVEPGSGRLVELHTDQPGVQFYSGNRLKGQVGKHGQHYAPNGGLCLEPQHHPDAVHRPEFPSILLQPGETYEHVLEFRFGIAPG
jgi:aldose 1-epimerase